jgi:hypothetical protein
MRRLGRARGRPPAAPCPFRVDLLPPPGGFDDAVEDDIVRFLEPRAGSFDIAGPIATGGDILRYSFARHIDAEAFHRRFAPAAEKAVLREVFTRPEKI